MGLYLLRSPSLAPKEATCGTTWDLRRFGKPTKRITCNARSAKRGERREEGEANIENHVQACNLKSSAQKVSQHRLRDLNLDVHIVPKCFPNRPRELQNHSPELPRSSRGAPQSSRGLPKSVPGAPRSPNRAPQAPKGCPRCVQRVAEAPFGRHFGAIWASKLKSRNRCWLTF